MHLFFIYVSSSGIIWEQCKLGSRRYKKIEGPKLIQLEEAYQKYLTYKMVSDKPVSPKVQIDEKTEVSKEMYVII